jgi:hypothetical protein
VDHQHELTQQKGNVLTVMGRNVACPMCGRDRFSQRTSLLNTAGAKLCGLGWANKEAYNYICTQCGCILWFLPQ